MFNSKTPDSQIVWSLSRKGSHDIPLTPYLVVYIYTGLSSIPCQPSRANNVYHCFAMKPKITDDNSTKMHRSAINLYDDFVTVYGIYERMNNPTGKYTETTEQQISGYFT